MLTHLANVEYKIKTYCFMSNIHKNKKYILILYKYYFLFEQLPWELLYYALKADSLSRPIFQSFILICMHYFLKNCIGS